MGLINSFAFKTQKYPTITNVQSSKFKIEFQYFWVFIYQVIVSNEGGNCFLYIFSYFWKQFVEIKT